MEEQSKSNQEAAMDEQSKSNHGAAIKGWDIKPGLAVFGLTLAAVLGATLVSAAWLYSFLTGGSGKPSNDPPVTGQGGSFGVHGNVPWSIVGKPTTSPYYASANFVDASGNPAHPIFLNFRGVDTTKGSITNPTSVMNVKTTGNWSIVLDYRDPLGHHADGTTTLSICTESDCGVNTNAVGTTIYLVGSLCPDKKTFSGTFLPQTIDRGYSAGNLDSIFYDLQDCTTSSPLLRHEPRAHIYDVSLDYYDTNSNEQKPVYHCVDGACTIGLNYQKSHK